MCMYEGMSATDMSPLAPGGGPWRPPHHTAVMCAAIPPTAMAAHMAGGEGQQGAGAGGRATEAIKLRREAGERLAGWRTEVGWRHLRSTCKAAIKFSSVCLQFSCRGP